MGQECTISAYQRVRIGEQCVIADRAMFIDFDHGVVEVERPIREQGIYKRDVEVGSNVWIGYGACILRGVRVGDNSIVGTNSVVTKDVPANAVVAGIPARVIRMREAPRELRWADPVEPDPAAETTLPISPSFAELHNSGGAHAREKRDRGHGPQEEISGRGAGPRRHLLPGAGRDRVRPAGARTAPASRRR